jgi:uncharacterized protein
MDLFSVTLIVLGLVLFEIINSVDNAIINAEVLGTMSYRARRLFLFVGILTAVFLVRGLLPWIIVWVSNPSLSLGEAFIASFSSDPAVHEALEASAPILLTGSGVFLVLLFLHWFFMEEKHVLFRGVESSEKRSLYYFSSMAALVGMIILLSLGKNRYVAFAAVVGMSIFILMEHIKDKSETHVRGLKTHTGFSNMAKIGYLEAIDASFSVDGVLGAFAFTFSVPLIIIGSGIGAIVVRNLTIRNIETIHKYRFVKNGAMYSILFLGCVMLFDAFGVFVPYWVSPVVTFFIVAFFFGYSKSHLSKPNVCEPSETGK